MLHDGHSVPGTTFATPKTTRCDDNKYVLQHNLNICTSLTNLPAGITTAFVGRSRKLHRLA